MGHGTLTILKFLLASYCHLLRADKFRVQSMVMGKPVF